jgi:hypothetical protein
MGVTEEELTEVSEVDHPNTQEMDVVEHIQSTSNPKRRTTPEEVTQQTKTEEIITHKHN